MAIQLPPILRRLVEADLWQSENPMDDARIPRSVARRWDPSATGIHLSEPVPLASQLGGTPMKLLGGSPFLEHFGALEQISVPSCWEIADFGLGADSPIIVDIDQEGHPVSYLHWIVKGYRNGRTEWRRIGDLATFVKEIFPDGPQRPPFQAASSIEVNNSRYYWRPSIGADYLTILVQHVNGTGQQVEAQWVRPSGAARNLEAVVNELVTLALERGWTPHVPAAPLRLSDMDAAIAVPIYERPTSD